MRQRCRCAVFVAAFLILAGCAGAPPPAPEARPAGTPAPEPVSHGGTVPAAGSEFGVATAEDVEKPPRNSALDASVDVVLGGSAAPTQIRWGKFGMSAFYSLLGNFDTEIRVDSRKVPLVGTRLSLEDDLGFDSKASLLTLGASYSFNRYHRIDFLYFDINRTATAQTKEEIRWEDYVIPKTKVRLEFRTQIFKFSYRYNFIVRKDWEVGAGVGIHWMQLTAGYNIQTKPTDAAPETYQDSVTLSQGLPLPLIGFGARLRPADDWAIFTDVGWFSASILGIRGFIFDARVGVAYRVWGPVFAALEYNLFALKVDASNDNWHGEAAYAYQGVLFGLGLTF